MRELLGWLMGMWIMKVEWRCVSRESGEQSVTMVGMQLMLM